MNNYNRIVLLLFLILGTNIPVLGMKRANEDMQEVKPPVAGDILQLPDELLCRIIMSCRAPWRNALRNVCRHLRELASKQNQALHDNLDNVSLEDKKEFLTKYLAEGNIPMVSHIMQSCPPKTLLWLKKRWLLDYLDAGNIPMAKAILEHCPVNEFSKDNITYNYVLYLKYMQRKHQDKTGEVNILFPLIDNHNICVQLKNTGDLDPDGSVQKLLANQQQDVAAWVEKFWANALTQESIIGDTVWRCIKLLRYAAIVNNHAMVKALLQTTPFKTYFRPVLRNNLEYNQYPNLLYDAFHYGDAALFADIFSWIYPIETLEQEPDDLQKLMRILVFDSATIIAMNKSEHLKPIMFYLHTCLKKYSFMDNIKLNYEFVEYALTTKSWSCLEIIIDAFHGTKRRMNLGYFYLLPMHNSVLHEAGLLKGPAPIDTINYDTYYALLLKNHLMPDTTQYAQQLFCEQQKIAHTICALKKDAPAIFEKLSLCSAYVYTHWAVELIAYILQPTPPLNTRTGLPALEGLPLMIQDLLPLTIDIRTTLMNTDYSAFRFRITNPFIYDPAITDFVITVAYSWHSFLTRPQEKSIAHNTDLTERFQDHTKSMLMELPITLIHMDVLLQATKKYCSYDSRQQIAERLAMVIKELEIYRDSTIQKNSH